MARVLQVLLVEDDDIFAMLLGEAVNEHLDLKDCIVMQRLSDGDEVDGYLQSISDPSDFPDFIILDQRMPRMDGTAVLEQLRQNERTRITPVCMLSTSNQPKLLQASYERGANFCLTKPSNLDELVEKVGQLLFFLVRVMEIPEVQPVQGESGPG